MKITDQPGRYFTVIFLCPFLLYLSYLLYTDGISKESMAMIISVFSIIFFLYELFWIINYPSKKIEI